MNFVTIVRDGKAESAEIEEIDGQNIVVWAVRFGLGCLAIVVMAAMLASCALPLIGGAVGGASAAYSYSERDDISADLIKTTVRSIENARRLDVIENWAVGMGFKK